MKLDSARTKTDKLLEKLEKDITSTYKKAKKEITKKWDSFMADGKKELDDIMKSGDQKAYQKALEHYTLGNEYYKEMVDETTLQLANANKTATAYINNTLPEIYATNYNQIASDFLTKNKGIDTSFKIVNKDTVKRLMTEKSINLLPKRLDIPRDMRWNKRKINSAVLQSIVQGESVDKLSQRLLPIMNNNIVASLRNARTMVTGAENLGRLDSYERLEEDGVVMKKVWIATPDDRTREWHLDMDGQEVDLDEPFIDGNGNELDYPGDPTCDAPETIYNCRCSMGTHIIGFKDKDGNVVKVDYEPESDEHDKAILDEQKRRWEETSKPNEKDIPDIVFEGAEVWNDLIDKNDLDVMEDWTNDWLNVISDEEREGVRTYTGSAYTNMNQYLRGITDNNRFPEEIKNCTSALEKASMPERTIVTRGSGWGAIEGLVGEGNGKELLERLRNGELDVLNGAILNDKGFLSTTPDLSGGFDGSVRYMISIPEGAQAMYVDSISKYRGELELLIQRDSKFLVHEVTEGWDSNIVIYMSMLT